MTARATAMIAAYLGMFAAMVNQTVVATAMPAVVEDLGGLRLYSWVFSAYMLTTTASLPIYGKLSDAYGRRPFLLLGVALFSAGSVLCATAGSIELLIAARAIQGAGAGALLLVALATVGDLVEPHGRGKWHMVPGLMFAAASIVGPLLGGVLADHGHWRWVFIAPLPIALVGLLGGMTRVPSGRAAPSPHGIDYLGAALLVAGLTGALLFAGLGGLEGHWSTPPIIALGIVSAALLAALVARELAAADPILPVRVLRRPAVLLANGAGFTCGVALFCGILFVPLAWQTVVGGNASSSALVLVPMMLAFGAGGVVAGYFAARLGRVDPLLIGGPPLIAGGFLVLSGVGPGTEPAEAIAAVTAIGLGIGFIFQTLLLVVQNAAPARDLGAATSSAQFSRQLGGAVGIAVTGAVFNAGLPGGPASGPLLGGEAGTASSIGPEIFADALHPVFLMLAAVALVALLAARAASGSYAESHRASLPAPVGSEPF